ncbi:M28 family peptidase [Parerythrobacter aurantius]|uniref:M28 family peptidase n=1 Tax=Parerythrobacter aurantius TaxID=3127706 RepID=UPI00324D5876
MKGIRNIAGALIAGLILSACATVPGGPRDYRAAKSALSEHIRVLASEDYGGRMPGTEGGARTEQYLVDTLQRAGFEPGARGGEWRQPVVLARYSPGSASLGVLRDRTRVALTGDQLVATGREASWKDLPAEYVHFGEGNLPEGALKGRAAVIPAARVREAFGALSGAAPDAIIVLAATQEEFDGLKPALERGRWQLRDSGEEATRPAFVLVAPGGSAQLAELWKIGQDSEGPMRVSQLPGELSLSVSPKAETIETHNVIGKLPGKVRDSGAVMILAHWDHLGTCGPADAPDRLCNGAVDNASGIGVMLEVAKRVAAQGGLDRDLYVMGTTAEELGLLGAEAFAADPPFPLPTIVAAFNMDTVAIAPAGSPATVVGWGRTPLDAHIRSVVEAAGTKFTVLESTEQFVRRQDGWALLSRDVPTVLVSTSFGDEKAFNAFLSGPYHGADDEWRADLELGGATDDIFLHVALLKHFGSVARYQPGATPAAKSVPGDPEG